jgi:hypothetical protein
LSVGQDPHTHTDGRVRSSTAGTDRVVAAAAAAVASSTGVAAAAAAAVYHSVGRSTAVDDDTAAPGSRAVADRGVSRSSPAADPEDGGRDGRRVSLAGALAHDVTYVVCRARRSGDDAATVPAAVLRVRRRGRPPHRGLGAGRPAGVFFYLFFFFFQSPPECRYGARRVNFFFHESGRAATGLGA